jgi:hypothetical protein
VQLLTHEQGQDCLHQGCYCLALHRIFLCHALLLLLLPPYTLLDA